MKQLNVLFLGGAKRVSFAEHLKAVGKQRGMDVAIFSYELEDTVPIGKVAEVLIGLKWTDKNIYTDLKNVIAKLDIHIVLPFVDKAIEIAANLREHTCAFIPVSSVEICRTMFDKVQSSLWFDEKGIPQPPKYQTKDEVRYPAILKPRNGSASKGIIIAKKSDDFENIEWANYLVQEYIPNAVEYRVDTHFYKNKDVYDCDFEQEKHGRKFGMDMEKFLDSVYKMFQSYKELRQYADWKMVKVYNASEYSLIDCFERKKLR